VVGKYHYVESEPVQLTGLLAQFLRLHWTLVLMAAVMACYEFYFARLSVYSLWFLITFASTIGAGKWGAGDSYFATPLAATCILAGIFTARMVQQSWQAEPNYLSRVFRPIFTPAMRNFLTLSGLALFIVYGLTVIKLPTSGAIFEPLAKLLNVSPAPGHRYPLYDAAGWTVGYAVTGHFPSQADIDNGWQIVERVKAAPGYVMSEDAGFMFQAGREVITNAVQLRNLWELNLYDPANLIRMIENHEFGLIIRRADFFPPPVLVAIDTFYERETTIAMNGFDYQLWIPRIKSALPEQSAED
jgi:hypothetical protein